MFLKKTDYNFIDLFAGAGGLSEGFIQAGFNPIAHVEMNRDACKTLETRSCYYYLKKENRLNFYYDYLNGTITRDDFIDEIPPEVLHTVMWEEMSDKSIGRVFGRIDQILQDNHIETVDLIVGGPPCQAYSLVGRAQSSHMEVPMSQDPRNRLYLLYARFLKRYQPTMFVFENVTGIESANEGKTWRNIKKQLRRVGYEIECHKQNAYDFGVLQTRRRMIIIGWKKGSGLYYPQFETTQSNTTVNELLNDLPNLVPGESDNRYRNADICDYVRENKLRKDTDILTLHQSRPHTEQDIEIYEHAIRLWNDGHQRLKYDDLPDALKSHRNRSSFTDRFKVVEGDLPCCHTILAHLSKDGHYFIHPDIDQHRSITVREAARIQSFPDDYFFEGPRTAQFVQVGNAVPPLMAYHIVTALKDTLKEKVHE